ncbi:MAG: hypothetical protein AAGE85_02330 [Pseudomonadota bacterium]
MHRPFKKFIAPLVGIVAAIGMSGCSTTASIESSEQLAKRADSGETVVFGKFRLIRNGDEAKLGSGLFASGANLHLVNLAGGGELIAKVGRDGEFAWALEPGNYEVTAIGFDNRGEHQQADTSFTLAVSAEHAAVYIGTVSLEASFESGYYGFNGTVDDYTVSNDCAADCAARLDRLGLSRDAMAVALLQEQYHVARSN